MEDAVCYSFYAVDIHRADHVVFRNIKRGVYPTIPLGPCCRPAAGV